MSQKKPRCIVKRKSRLPGKIAFRPSLEEVVNTAARNAPRKLAAEIGRTAFIRKATR